MQPTISDVAKHAGVAPSTVSYVLSGNRTISPETRRRVEASIRALKYHPHAGARSMRAGRTDVIALVVPVHRWWSERILMPYVYGVLESARQHGWNVVLLTGPDGRSEIDRVVRSKMVDGLILMEVLAQDERVPLVADLGRPAVLLGVPDDPQGLPYVDFDFEAAGRMCVDHLAGLGHTEIGFFGPPQGIFDMGLGYAFRTRRGIAEGLARRELEFHGRTAETTPEGVQSTLQALFDEAPGLTALIVHNEGVLDLVLQGLGRLGRTVPDDVSVVAIARDAMAQQVVPALTCVAVPADEMGRQAIELLSSWDGRPRRRLLPPAVLRAASDSAPPGPKSTKGRHRRPREGRAKRPALAH
ncbi:MAG TPA: LacI family DNA-binding transcriptional regulator [Acidimicrobiales bacterium]|nr:LacI family DNA-binding transcriptional regulator [Acidimicrobiales bacterium]